MTVPEQFKQAAAKLNYPHMNMLVLSHSSRSMFRSCARKLEFRQFFGTPHTKQENYAGDVGNALHRGLGKWLMTQDERQAVMAYLMAFPYHLEFLKPGQSARSLEAGFATLEMLMGSYQLAGYEIAKIKTKDGKEEFCIEVPFAIKIVGTPMGEIPVWFVGFIDIILYNPATKTYLVVDLKTTRQTFEDYSARYQFDEQVIPYGIILEHALGQPIEEMEISYLSAYIDLIEPKIEKYDFKKTRQDIQDWHFGLSDDIARIAKYYKAAHFPRVTDGQTCISWNNKCQNIDECYYRDPTVLNRIIQGAPRQGLFTTGEEPWIVAELPFLEAA